MQYMGLITRKQKINNETENNNHWRKYMKIDINMKIPKLLFFFLILIIPGISQAQFLDGFDKDDIEGWFFFTGDGDATMDFVQKEDYARILVDATGDKHNVWWAIIKRDVSSYLDLQKLETPDFELRVEARVRVSNAPRRINFMINTNRTTNYHEHLMEYDIPDTTGWHTISMTTKNLDVVPDDTLYVQLGVTDWGLGKYYVDVDYYRADIVNVDIALPDKGEPLPYHPPVPGTDTFTHKLAVTHTALINSDFPDVNFNDWHIKEHGRNVPVLTVSANQWAVLRWDFDSYAESKADGAALLELTTQSILRGGDYIGTYGNDLGMEFGKVRVIEILGGDPVWNEKEVTYSSLIQGKDLSEVFNSQMVFDVELAEEPGSKNYITISKPVLQRLLNGETKGLLIKPLGALIVSFYKSENETGNLAPILYFNIKK